MYNFNIFADGININTTRDVQTERLTIGENGYCDLVYGVNSWFAVGNFLT